MIKTALESGQQYLLKLRNIQTTFKKGEEKGHGLPAVDLTLTYMQTSSYAFHTLCTYSSHTALQL